MTQKKMTKMTDEQRQPAGRADLTEVVFILDRSGSMGGLEGDTIGGFNAMIKRQKTEPGQALVTTVLFDDRVEVLHDRQAIEGIPALTQREYFVRGSTALLDAVGSSIERIARLHAHLVPSQRPGHTVFVITTDGLENASQRYGYPQVRRLIERQQETAGWEFVFLGANIDAAAEASRIGIGAAYAVDIMPDAGGTGVAFEAADEAISCVRACQPLACPAPGGGINLGKWRGHADSDYRRRSGKPFQGNK